MAQSNIVIESSVFIPADADKAFEATLPEIMALADDDTIPVNIDVITAATLVAGRIPVLKTLRPQIVEELPRFDLARFDKLEQYLLALMHAQGLHRGAQVPKAHVAALGSELTVIRDRFYGNAVSLAENGLLDGERLKGCKTAIGYRALIADIFILVPLFKEYWKNIEGKTPVTPAALHEATTRASQLLSAVGLRATNSEVVGEKAQLRAKAFTLFARTYEDTRHAVEYLRRKERDADEFAPSIYTGRGGRRRDDDGEQAEASPAAQNGGTASTKGGRSEPPPPIVIENPEGLPIDNPFTSN